MPFEWPALPEIGTQTAVPVEINHEKFVLVGVLKNVRTMESLGKALFGTEMSSEDMREAILPGELRLQKLSDWLA